METAYFSTPPGYLKLIAVGFMLAGLISFLCLLYGWAFMVFGTLMMGLCNSTLLILYHATGKLTTRDGFYESAFSLLMAVLLFISAILVGVTFNWFSAGIATSIMCGFGSLVYLLETGYNYQSAMRAQQNVMVQGNVHIAPTQPNVFVATHATPQPTFVVGPPPPVGVATQVPVASQPPAYAY